MYCIKLQNLRQVLHTTRFQNTIYKLQKFIFAVCEQCYYLFSQDYP